MAGVVLDVARQLQALPCRPASVGLVGGGAASLHPARWFADAGLAGAAMVAATSLGLASDWAGAAGVYAVAEASRVAPEEAGRKAWTRLLERFRAELGCISGAQKL